MRWCLFVAVASLLVGCGKGDFNSARHAKGKTLTYPLISRNVTLDPGKVNDAFMAGVLQNVGEGLLTYNEKSELVPCLAEKWEIEDGGKRYVFHLRKGVKFTNGRPVVAADVLWTWERNLSQAFAAPAAVNYLSSIVGVKEFAAGKAKTITGVQVVDDATIRVTLDAPRPYFLGNLTTTVSYVLAKEGVTDKGATKPEMLIATGPFTLKSYTPGVEIVLESNPGYWGGKPQVDKIVRPIILDASARLARYRSGELDYLPINRGDADSLKNDPQLKGQLSVQPIASLDYLILGQAKFPPFRNEHVRRAFAMAIDRPHLVQNLLTGFTEAKDLVPDGIPGFPSGDPGLGFDAEAARKELAAGGYPLGKGFPTLELDYEPSIPENRISVEAIAADLRRNLNIKVQPVSLDWAAILDRNDRHELSFGLFNWVADYLDPHNFLSLQLTSEGAQNKEGFHDAEFDALCAKADVEPDSKKRLDLYRQANRRAIGLAARIPLDVETQTALQSPRVKKFPVNAFGPMPMTTAEVVGS